VNRPERVRNRLVDVTHAPVTEYVKGVPMIDLQKVTSAQQRPQH
jgi:hypothetical protein